MATRPVSPGYTQGQVAASLAANPQASKGGYEGVGATYGTSAPMFPTGSDPSTSLSDPYDYSQDPILRKIEAGNVTARVGARAAALADAKRLAIGLGDASGFGLDDTAQQEAAGNPYSTLAGLLHNYQDTTHQHDETLNKNNLFYSGTRVKTLADDANNYQGQVAGARNTALGQFGDIQASLAQALSGYDQADINAEGDAYSRAQARALTYGYDPGQQTSVSNTGNKPPTPGTTTTGQATTTVSGTAPSTSPYGAPQSVGFGGTTGPYIGTLPKALAKPAAPKAPKMPNAYLTNPAKRG